MLGMAYGGRGWNIMVVACVATCNGFILSNRTTAITHWFILFDSTVVRFGLRWTNRRKDYPQ